MHRQGMKVLILSNSSKSRFLYMRTWLYATLIACLMLGKHTLYAACAGNTFMQIYSNAQLISGSTNALQRIQQLGFGSDWFTGAVTSGEVTHMQLADRPTAELQSLGSKCLHFTWKSRGTVSLEGLHLQVSKLSSGV